MEIVLFADQSLNVNLERLAEVLTSKKSNVSARVSTNTFTPSQNIINYRNEYDQLAIMAHTERRSTLSVFITENQHDNNYFYIGEDNLYLLSINGWERLTSLPKSNGILYLICHIALKHYLEVGLNHDKKTGCLNDFMWDKTTVDVGMRAAFLCEKCKQSTDKSVLISEEFKHFYHILDLISTQSRKGHDILEIENLEKPTTEQSFDIFLCHNSNDKTEIREINSRLKAEGIKTWFDEECLMPGEVWQDALEKQIQNIRCCGVFAGPHGEGPWQENERRAFINEFANRSCLIVPIIIDGISEAPLLPLFLKQFMWCDLRNKNTEQFDRLVTAIKSRR